MVIKQDWESDCPNSPHYEGGDVCENCGKDAEIVAQLMNDHGKRIGVCEDCKQAGFCAKCGSESFHINLDSFYVCDDCGYMDEEQNFLTVYV